MGSTIVKKGKTGCRIDRRYFSASWRQWCQCSVLGPQHQCEPSTRMLSLGRISCDITRVRVREVQQLAEGLERELGNVDTKVHNYKACHETKSLKRRNCPLMTRKAAKLESELWDHVKYDEARRHRPSLSSHCLFVPKYN